MEKVLCPWCGSEMVPTFIGKINWYRCRKCSASSPIAYSRDEAFENALRRYKPLQKPLTLEEMKEQKAVWIETDVVFPAVLDISDDAYNAFIRSDGDCFVEKTKLYGKCWRCWAKKPTDAEREAEKLE